MAQKKSTGGCLTELGIKKNQPYAFQSFRVTLIRRLKGIGVTKDARMELVGHAPRNVHDGDYPGQFEDAFLAEQTPDRAQFGKVNPEALSAALPERLSRSLTIALRGTRRCPRSGHNVLADRHGSIGRHRVPHVVERHA